MAEIVRGLKKAKPFLAVIFLQFGNSGMSMVAKFALNQGMSQHVLVVYRHAIATLFIAPFAFVFDRKVRPKMTVSTFLKILLLALLEPTIDQNLFYTGMKYTTATFASAMCNVLPAFAFLMAWICRRASQKLASRFYGPYPIEEKIGKVAYKLRLPEGARIHPVFHVSMLKKQVGKTSPISTELPPIADGDIVVEPETILDTRWVKRGSGFAKESLVQWKKLPKEDATWEDTQELRSRFVNLNLEDKVQLI